MDSALSQSHLKHITYADKGKRKVLGLGRVAISKDRHMDKVMLVESLGFILMSISMFCDLVMAVIFGKYRCIVLMESDKSKVFEGFRREDLYIVDFFAGPPPATCLLAKASEGWLWHHRLGHAGMRCTHLCTRSMSLASRVSNSAKIIFAGLVRLERLPYPSIPRRLS